MESITPLPNSIRLMLIRQAREAMYELLKDETIGEVEYADITDCFGCMIRLYEIYDEGAR